MECCSWPFLTIWEFTLSKEEKLFMQKLQVSGDEVSGEHDTYFVCPAEPIKNRIINDR